MSDLMATLSNWLNGLKSNAWAVPGAVLLVLVGLFVAITTNKAVGMVLTGLGMVMLGAFV